MADVPAPEAPKPVAEQRTYKITTPDGKTFEFPGLAEGPDGITVASLIDVFWVALGAIAADNPTVRQILEANDVIQRDVNGGLFFPRPKAVETPTEITL